MKSRVLILTAAIAFAAPLAAQRVAQSQAAPTAESELKSQVNTFELMLRSQFNAYATKLGEWAQNVAPGVLLVPATDPSINGFPLPTGFVFALQVPDVIGVQLVQYYQNQPQNQGQSNVNSVQPPRAVPAAPGKQGQNIVGAIGKCDPSDPSSVDTRQQYRECVRQAMIEAIVNSSGILSVKEGQWLSIAASGIEDGVTNPFSPNRSRKLVLSAKGEDLQALRQGKISKDELRKRIEEK